MGFKYTHRVYNDVHDTTATEQQVLALLAHFADDEEGTRIAEFDMDVLRHFRQALPLWKDADKFSIDR
jgi:predicted amidohydrolase